MALEAEVEKLVEDFLAALMPYAFQSLDTIKQWAIIYRETAGKYGRRSEVALARSAWIAPTKNEVEGKWWPYVKAFYQPYIRLGLFKDITLSEDPSTWSFDQVAPNRLIAGKPDDAIREIERYRAELACESMIFLFRHPQGPEHREVVKCIELFGKEVIPHFKAA